MMIKSKLVGPKGFKIYLGMNNHLMDRRVGVKNGCIFFPKKNSKGCGKPLHA
jgi:hypothetical protein